MDRGRAQHHHTTFWTPAPHVGCGALCWPHQHRVAHCAVQRTTRYRVENRLGANARRPNGRPSAPHPISLRCSPAYVVLSTFLWKTGTLGIRMPGFHCCESALCNARGSASVLATVVAMLRRPMQWRLGGDAGGAAQYVHAQRDWFTSNAQHESSFGYAIAHSMMSCRCSRGVPPIDCRQA